MFTFVKIRKCKEEDLERVYEIERLSFKFPYPTKFFYDFMDKLFFVLEDKGEIIGYIIADKKRSLIISIAVHPLHRRKGYGKMLMEHVLKFMKGKVMLHVKKSNLGAIDFYKKLGFEEIGEIKGYYRDGEDAILMAKMLS
ncbi:MAG: ribosomal-protein-alanine N-acetyltransferase [Thermoplasmata archaeon]|nr:MAG: ribosomal-protein-alanine N-acetyltransferase [Thermoplasmata archaeon]OYT59791.1 MAG: ribosomal-protein-alanine N-acetyltransferase [Thermoplasmatales archaeon ex4484_30]